MSRLLLLVPTTTYRAGAFVDAAQSLDVELAVATETPSSLAHLLPHVLPSFPFEPDAAADAAAEWAARWPVDAVVAVDDASVEAAAAVAERLGLPHHSRDAVVTCRDKIRTRRALETARVPQPEWIALGPDESPRHAARALGVGPLVVKLRNGSASAGVLRADTPGELDAAARRVRALAAERGDERATILVERFVDGPEVAVEGIVDGERIHVFAVFDKPEPLDGPAFPETIYVTPSTLAPDDLDVVVDCVERTVRATGLSFGPFHAELRVGPDGPRLIEIAPRSIGGRCAAALRFEGGESLERVILRHALARGLDAPPARERPASGVCMLPVPRSGVVAALEGVEAARAVAGVDDVVMTAYVGRRMRALPEAGQYVGFVFARGDEPGRVVDSLTAARARIRVEMAQAPERTSGASDAASGGAPSAA